VRCSKIVAAYTIGLYEPATSTADKKGPNSPAAEQHNSFPHGNNLSARRTVFQKSVMLFPKLLLILIPIVCRTTLRAGAGPWSSEDHARISPPRIVDESVAIDENSVLVLKQVGPCGAPGMPSGASSPEKKHRTPI